ncbi:MAG: DUF4422 domain-containing protein [Clostridia bacterium]|nr:DUF4422 domain-containing protein [Clostridia bacterium]
MEKIKIIVATHKEAKMPSDEMYIPLLLGAELRKETYGYTPDNTGDNISEKNPNFGTQTGLYWLWKNVDAEYKGLVHYRRYFVIEKNKKVEMTDSAIKREEILPLLNQFKIFVPKKRKYYIETIRSHYEHTHDETHFQVVEEIIKKDCPSYLNAFYRVLNRRWGYMFNMMILKSELMDDYCTWLFNILFQCYPIINNPNMSAFDSRFCGRISEILFDVWLEYNIEQNIIKKDEVKELDYIEDVNWSYKIKSFFQAKFMHKKYGKSS